MLKLLILLLPVMAVAKSEKRIIGLDQRVQINSYSDSFYRTVGLLNRKGKGFCTATLISPQHIITNGHCVVKSIKKFPTSLLEPSQITFIPGMLGPRNSLYGAIKIKKINTFRAYVEEGSTSYDVAVLELAQRLPLNAIRRLRVTDSLAIENTPLFITGYSSKKTLGTMWEGRGITRDADSRSNLVYHDVDTLPGTSGAILRIRSSSGWVAIGVHRGPDGLLNNGVFFTPEISDAINRWVR